MKIHICIVFFLNLVFIGCRDYNPSDRDYMLFNFPFNQIKDSLVIMDQFLENFSQQNKVKASFCIDKIRIHNDLYFTGKRVINLDKIAFGAINVYKDSSYINEIYSQNVFEKLPHEAIARFLNLALFLNLNEIHGAFKDFDLNVYVFDYKDSVIVDDVDRIIFVKKRNPESEIAFLKVKNKIKIYDEKDGLVLYNPNGY